MDTDCIGHDCGGVHCTADPGHLIQLSPLAAGWARKVENGMECAVLAALFFFAALLGQVQYGLYGSFLLPSAYGNARQVVFLLVRCWALPPPWARS